MSSVVDLHLQCFPKFFLTKLGRPFLQQFYSEALSCRSVVAIVAETEDCEQSLGFAMGFVKPQELRERLKSRWFRFVFPALVAGLRNPSLILTILRSLLRVGSSRTSVDEFAELSSIAAKKNSLGVGSKLLAKFLTDCFSRSASVVTLTTDAEFNDKVISFYIKNGFYVDETRFRGRRKMLSLRLDLIPIASMDLEK